MYFKRDIEDKFISWLTKDTCSLEVLGARQVGKTTTILNFAKNYFKNIVYINLSEVDKDVFLNILNNTRNVLDKYDPINFEENMIANGYPYKNSKDTVIIIDEIQLDYNIYNHIRILTRSLESRLIVTGSYLGRALYNHKFFIPAGDLEIITMYTLSFHEFLNAFGQTNFSHIELPNFDRNTDLTNYKSLFEIYKHVGGYPAVVDTLIKTGSVNKAQDMLSRIIRTFLQESKNYTEYLSDAYLLENALQSVCDLLLKEKRGGRNLYESIRNHINTKVTNKVNTETAKNIITWLHECGLIGFCDKCDIQQARHGFHYKMYSMERFYFMDLGVLRYYLNSIILDKGTIDGIVAENYIYIVLNSYLSNQTQYHRKPMYAICGNYEIDFYMEEANKRYLIEVKAGVGKARSLEYAKKNEIADIFIYLSNSDSVSINDNSMNIPIYLAERLRFSCTDNYASELDDILKKFSNFEIKS